MLPPIRCLLVVALALVPGALAASSARATYSIVAADTRTRAVGGAGASCVYPNQVSIIYGVAPGFGAVHAQAQANQAGRDLAAQLLMQGEAPAAVIAAITASSFDASAARRQYGVVDVLGKSAGYTGTQNTAFADDVQGTVDGYVYSAQGNILTGTQVLEQAATAFELDACDLPERLLRALEAGAKNGQGDTRCTGPSAIAANSAFIQVDLPGMPAGSYLKLSAGSGRGVDPLPALRSAFDRWRSTHPCGASDAGAVTSDASLGDAAAVDAGWLDAGWLDASTIDAASTPDAAALLDAAKAVEASVVSSDARATAAPDVTDAASQVAPKGGMPTDSGAAARPDDVPEQESGCRVRGAGRSGSGLMWLAVLTLVFGSRALRPCRPSPRRSKTTS